MPKALCVIRNEVSYRREFFLDGLRAIGFEIADKIGHDPRPDDVLVVWNRHGGHDVVAKRFEAVGAKVIVAENGYIGKGPDGHKLYSLALNHHQGLGRWHVGTEDRWSKLGIELKPWRATGDHILLLPSRGIGEPGIAQPRTWLDQIQRELMRRTKRPVRVRLHPGLHLRLNDSVMPDLKPDLENCHAVITWASGAAIKAIISGVPAFYSLKGWVGAGAAKHVNEDLEDPFLGNRLPMLRRAAWSIFSAQEIATGEPLQCLLNMKT